jgi:PAS domain-containing protein
VAAWCGRRAGFRVLIDQVTALTHIPPISPPAPARPTSVGFCSRCGVVSEKALRRVCERCEAGVVLTCRRDALPGDAFLICSYELAVTAVSEAGEQIFGEQDELLGANLLDLATCPLGDDQLARHTALAATRAREPVELPMRLLSDKGGALGTLAARVTTCGPPRAALVTVRPTGFGLR